MDRFEFGSRSRRLRRLLGAATGKTLIGPQVVSLEITHHCNLRCSFCESHGILQSAPITSRRTYQGGRSKMELATIQRLAGELAEVGVDLVELSGKGDPIAHPQLTEVVRALRGAGLDCAMVTNGTLARDDLAATLVETGLSRLNVSMNSGSREVYQRSNNRDLWDKAIHFLRNVLDERRKQEKTLPWVRLSNVITRDNVEDFPNMVKLAMDLDVEEITFYAMGELPETHQLQLSEEQVRWVHENVSDWSRRLNQAGVAHSLAVFARDLTLRVRESSVPATSQAVTQDNPLQRGIPCYEGWVFCVIAPDGTVVPCCYCEEEQLGNVTDTSFVDIWYGALYRQFRKASLDMPKTGRWICAECFTSCNRAQQNLHIHRRVRPLWQPRLPEPTEAEESLGRVT